MVDGHAFGQCRARPVDRIQGASGALHGTEDPKRMLLGNPSKSGDLTMKNGDLMGFNGIIMGL